MRLRDIPGLYDIETMLERSGVQVSGTSGARYCVCPLPQHAHSTHPTPSFSIFSRGGTQRFKCHGNCGLTGNVIDFIGYMELSGYDKSREMYRKAAELLTGGEYRISPPEIPQAVTSLPNWLWEEMIPPSEAAVRYALSRGIGEMEIEEFRLGTPAMKMKEEPYNLHSPRKWMSMPTFHLGELVGIKLRRIQQPGERVKVRFLQVPGSRKGLFNHDAVYLEQGIVFVVKAEITTMVLTTFARKHNLPLLACAPTGGEGAYVTDIQHALGLARVIVVGDNDPGTIGERTKAQAERRAAEFNGILRFPPPEFKDLDDFIRAKPNEARSMIEGWISDVENRSG